LRQTEHVRIVSFYLSEKLTASTNQIKRIVYTGQNWSTQAKI